MKLDKLEALLSAADDPLSLEHMILVEACRTADEEAHVLNYWIDCCFDTDLALTELKLFRDRAKSRRAYYKRRPRRPPSQKHTPPVEPCDPTDLVPLTEREALVWSMRAEGYSYEEIGKAVGVSAVTIYNELDLIQEKFQKYF